MHSYPLQLGPGAARTFGAQADLFVYESGQVTPDTGDLRIIVKPDTGGEIVLRPGQRFRIAPGALATAWNVSAFDAAVSIAGQVIIGTGEFDDANTINTFKLDGTFSNTVTVANTAGDPVPVAVQGTASVSVSNTVPVTLESTRINNTEAQRVPVTLDPGQVLNTSDSLMSYTNNVKLVTPAANTNMTIFTPAANVNGIIIEQILTNAAAGTLQAKAGAAPTGADDGEVLAMQISPTGPMVRRIKIPAGKGGYVYNNSAGTAFYVCYTVL